MSEKRIPENLPVQVRAAKVDSFDYEKRTVTFALSSETPVSRWYGDEILDHSSGCIDTTRLDRGIALLFNHDPNQQLGRIESYDVRDSKLYVTARFGAGALAQEKLNDVRDGILVDASVGYIPSDYEFTEGRSGKPDTVRWTRWMPAEGSLTTIPADCTVGVGRAAEIPPGTPVFPVRSLSSPKNFTPAAAENTEVRNMPEPTTAIPDNAAELALRNLEELDVVHSSYPEIFTAAKRSEFAKAKRSADEARKFVLEEMGKRSSDAAVPAAGSPGVQVTLDASEKRDKTEVLGGCIRAFAAVKGRSVREAAQFAERNFKDPIVARALSASAAQDGGFSIPEDVLPGVLELLRPASVVRSLNPTVLPMPNGQLTQNRLTSGTGFQYIGENKAAPVTSAKAGQMKLSAKKGAALLPISNDLIRYGGSQYNVAVTSDLVRAVAQGEDIAFIRNTGSSYSPRGLRWLANAANVIAANGTVNLANVTNDLGKLHLALRQANIAFTRPGYIMSPRTEFYLMTVRDGLGNFAYRAEMLTGKLFNNPYRVTTQIPENLTDGTQSELYFVDFAEVVIGETMAMTFETSTEASYTDGSTTISAFQNDQTLVRVLVEHDINVNYDKAIAVLTGVTWGV